MPDDGASVTYSIREMFAEIKASLADISSRLDSKADRLHVEQMGQQITDLQMNGSRTAKDTAEQVHDIEGRVRVLENTSNAIDPLNWVKVTEIRLSKLERFKWGLLGGASAVGGITGVGAAVVAAIIQHHH